MKTSAKVGRGHITRRDLLIGSASLIPISYLSGCQSTAPTGAGPLFTLGVASGEPTPTGVVLWTRLAPDPINGGGMPDRPVEVSWAIAEDDAMRRVVRRGNATAEPADAHSVHVEAGGLEPGRTYWYRFVAAGEASPIGRTRTAPAADAELTRFRFAFASCQHYEHGFYAAHRHLAAEDLDLVLFLGDYIYESNAPRGRVREHGLPEALTLADYRNRYARYKSDPNLQAAHAAFPWAVTWDDHEVSNDYADDRGEHLAGPEFLARRAAAYKAYWEHMPLPSALRPNGTALPLYRSRDFGHLVRFTFLDDRQYRDHEVCPRPNFVGGSNFVTDAACPARRDPQRSILGTTQETWAEATLDQSPARWNVLAQQTLVAQFARTTPDRRFWTDGWDGYPAARKHLINFIAARRPANPLFVGGDVHATFVTDLMTDFDDPRAAVAATEICGTSMTTFPGLTPADIDRQRADAPYVKYGNASTRGYIRVELDRQQAVAELRGILDPARAESAIETVARFVVEDGRPGARRA
jgi:alkaline phosphatase D